MPFVAHNEAPSETERILSFYCPIEHVSQSVHFRIRLQDFDKDAG